MIEENGETPKDGQVIKLPETSEPPPEGEPTEEENRRSDWERNNRAIRDAIITFFKKNAKLPLNRELAEITGISERTIQEHLDSLDFDTIFKYSKSRMMTYAPDVFLSVVRQALKGNSKAQTLFFTLIGFIQKNELIVGDETKSKLHELVYGKPGEPDTTEQTGEPAESETPGDNPTDPPGEPTQSP